MVTTLSPAAARAAAGGALLPIELGRRSMADFHMAAMDRPRGMTELRYKAPVGMRQEWHRHPVDAAARAVELSDRTDVYFGVVRRYVKGGGTSALAPLSHHLWCDCDNEMALERALAWGRKPHLMVQSSPGRAHLYWILRTGVPLDLLERANKRLAFLFGGDLRATDAARILRVAGTFNHKREAAQPVLIVGAEPDLPEYGSGELVADLADPAPPKVKASRPARPRLEDPDRDRLLSVRSAEYVSALAGRDVTRDGFVTCPFHKGGQERTPSLHVGGTHDTLWYCHGCQDGGDIFTFAGKLWGLEARAQFPDLMDRLEREFS